jgi:hypothetical protein
MPTDPTAGAPLPKLPRYGGAFARGVAAGLTPIEAAKEAGVPAAKAQKVATKLLADPGVKATIRVIRLKEVDAAAILLELANIGFVDIGDLHDPVTGHPLPLAKIPPHVRRAIAGVKTMIAPSTEKECDDGKITVAGVCTVVDYELWDKPKALALLGRAQGMFTDKVEVSGSLTLEQLVLAADKKIRNEKTPK